MVRELRKAKKTSRIEEEQRLKSHVQSLGLATVAEYREWCLGHGFSRSAQKRPGDLRDELAFAARQAVAIRLARNKGERRRPEEVIERIFRGEAPAEVASQPQWGALCRAYKASADCRHTKQSALRLLSHVCRNAELLSAQPAIAEYGWQEGNSLIEGLVAMACFGRNWIRQVEEWKPKSHNPRRQFSALARHLFASWPVPAFMDSVWFKGHSQVAIARQAWFVHVGQGNNIRTADLPIAYTKRMAHHFMQAPADFNVEAALRWGQIHALGGAERLVRAVVATRLGAQFEHDDFWSTVFAWFVAHPMLDPAQVGPAIDYLHDQKFTLQDVLPARGARDERHPPQPNLTMKGRTPEVLLRQIEAWHRRLATSNQPAADWPVSGIAPFRFMEGNQENGTQKIWTLTELLSSKALIAEGRKLNHCVATYARSCSQGRCSIWTLELSDVEGTQKLLTIEVNNSARLICQARGKRNAPPSDKHRGILRRWAEEARLRLGSYV